VRVICIAIAVVAATASTHATVVIPASLSELTRDAQAIARGRVVGVRARWTEDRQTIETIVSLEAEEYLKGRLGSTVEFRVPGGAFGRYRSVVVGAPQFAVGQRVIVFLGARGPMVPYVLGLYQGVYRLSRDAGGEWFVTPPEPRADSGLVRRGSATLAPAALADFEREIRSLVAQAR
jgi:hypothetical protein